MFWILQNNIYSEEGWHSLVEALDRLGIKYSVHKVVPFAGIMEPEPQPPPGPVIVMGSYTLANEAIKRGWKPGAFITDHLDYELQLKHWGHNMFNSQCWIGELKDVPEQHKPFFIRPTADSKAFTGYITDWPSFKEWVEREQRQSRLYPQDGGAYFNENTRVLVAPKREIVREYRTWIVDGKVVTASLYKQGPHKYARPEVDERVIQFANNMAGIFQPARAFVLDVFQTPTGHPDWDDGDLWIGEINNINSAGFYAADMQKLVAALDAMQF